MWRNRIVVLSGLAILGVAFSLTLSAQGSQPASPPPAGTVGHFVVVPMHLEYLTVNQSTAVRIDTQTGQAWMLNVRMVQQGQQSIPVWEWIDLRDLQSRPKP